MCINMFINSDLLSSGPWEQNKMLLKERKFSEATDPKMHREEGTKHRKLL